MHQMNDYERDMISQRHQHDMHNAQQWRQSQTPETDPAPHTTNEARPSLFLWFISATAQGIRRVLTANRQGNAAVTHRVETPVEFQ